MDRMIRELQETTGDVVVVAHGADGRAVRRRRASTRSKLFENQRPRRSAQKGKDNGLLILLALKERRVQDRGRLRPRAVHHRRLRRRDEPRGDGAGVSQRAAMAPACWPGTERIIGRIAQGRERHARRACARRDAPRRERAARRFRSGAIVVSSSSSSSSAASAAARRRGVRYWGGGRGAAGRAASARSAADGWRWFRRRVRRWWRRRRFRRLRRRTQRRRRWRRRLVTCHESTKLEKTSVGFGVFSLADRSRSVRYEYMTRRTCSRTGCAGARLAADRLLLQQVRRPGRSDQGAVGAGGEPAAAPQRSDSEPGRDREGLRRSTKKASSRRSPTRGRGCSPRNRPKKRSRRPTSRRRRSAACSRSSRTIRSCAPTNSSTG